jgi:transcriptional regulator with XRE-family HTH domain
MAHQEVHEHEGVLVSPSDAISTSAYVRSVRVRAGLSVAELAERAGVSSEWLEQVEGGVAEVLYDQLLELTRAAQPPRPERWDDGHEHDLHLPPEAVVDRDRNPGYWTRIEEVREAIREARG